MSHFMDMHPYSNFIVLQSDDGQMMSGIMS